MERYLEASGETPLAFALRLGISDEELADIVSGAQACSLSLARLIVTATGGSVGIGELLSPNGDSNVIDLLKNRQEPPLDSDRLSNVLLSAFGFDESSEISEAQRLIVLMAAEATANTYDALDGVKGRPGPDRLQIALSSVLEEILKESADKPSHHPHLQEAAAQAAYRYFDN